jgi:uncharacterized membrane protein YtjA (UPF0391 family)
MRCATAAGEGVGAVLREPALCPDKAPAASLTGDATDSSETRDIAANPAAKTTTVPTGAIPMLYYAVVFFVIALIAALFGFGGIAASAASIAQILFIVFAVLTVASLIVGLIRRG